MSFWERQKHAWWLPYLEALGGILLLTGFFLNFYGVSSLLLPRFHPFLPLVLLIAARYGFLPGVVSGLLGSLDYYILLLWQDHWDSLMPEGFSFLWPSAFLFSGMIVGELKDSDSRRYAELEEQFIKEKDAAKTASLQVDILIKAKRELEKRIFLDPNLASDLFDVFRSLEKDEIDSISPTLLSLCISFVGADSVGLYRRDRDHFFLEASAGIFDLPEQIDKKYSPFLKVHESRRAMTIRENGVLPELALPSGKVVRPLCIYPVLSDEYRVAFLLVIWHAPFEKLTPDFFQMMRMIVDRASARLEFLESHQKTRESISIDEVTGFLRPVFFARRASEELNKSHRYHAPLSLLEISFLSETEGKIDYRSALAAVREIVKRLLRDVDFSGLTGSGTEVCLCLPHTAADGAQVVQKKFLGLWDDLLPSFPLLHGVKPEVCFRTYLPAKSYDESDKDLYRSLMTRLDSVYLRDPSTGFTSGQGFLMELQREKSVAGKEGESIGLLRVRFTAPSWEDVVSFGKALGTIKSLDGNPLLPLNAVIGTPLEGNSMWILIPRAGRDFLEAVQNAVSSVWGETDIPRLKRGSFEVKAGSFSPKDFPGDWTTFDGLMQAIGWSDRLDR
ncbi:MAG: hypothetical protein ACYCXP_09655 [Leptospirillum sp.]